MDRGPHKVTEKTTAKIQEDPEEMAVTKDNIYKCRPGNPINL